MVKPEFPIFNPFLKNNLPKNGNFTSATCNLQPTDSQAEQGKLSSDGVNLAVKHPLTIL